MKILQRTAETARGRTGWLETGAGWPLLLVHAFPLNAAMWRPQLDRPPAGWRLIAPDLRGFGASAPPSGSMAVDDYAADVFALMDHLEIDAAVIGGLSLGADVALAMFRQAPARCTGMILASTRGTADTPEERGRRMELRRLLADGGAAGVAGRLLPQLLSGAAGAEVIAQTRGLIESAEAAGLDAALGALLARPDATPDLARIGCGTLVVAAEADALVPVADADAMQRAIPRSTLAVIAAAGHLSNLEQPAVFSRVLGDFLLSAL